MGRNRKIEKALVLLVLLISTRASRLANSDIVLIAATVIAAYFYFKKGNTVDKRLYHIGFAIVFLSGFYWIQFGGINVSAMGRFFVKILLVYFVLKIVRSKFFDEWEEIVYKLSLLGLPLYVLQQIYPQAVFNTLYRIQQMIPFMGRETADIANVFIYTSRSTSLNRNAGFMWEPGGYGAILALALFYGLVKNGGRIRKRQAVLGLILITTFSTTAYINAVIIIAFVVINSKSHKKWIAIPVALIVSYGIINTDFVKAKIDEQLKASETILEDVQYLGANERGLVSLGRFGSLYQVLKDIKKSPVLGIGFQYEERTTGTELYFQYTNGLADYLLKFGFVGIGLLLYNLYRTKESLADKHRVKGMLLFVVIILVIAFSNPVLLTPLFIGFQMYGYLNIKKRERVIPQASA